MPPFLLVYADGDFPGFGQALKKVGGDAACLRVGGRTHASVATRTAEPEDPARRAVLEFFAMQGGP